MRSTIVKLIATGLGSGYCRPFPGTWGSIPAWLIAFFLVRGNTAVLLGVLAVCFAASVWAAGEAEKQFGHDARKIVIDEWVGMFITLTFMPYTLEHYIAAFVAFRFFDVVKIPPASQSERLPGGWGVTMDDVVAGVQANLATQLVMTVTSRYLNV